MFGGVFSSPVALETGMREHMGGFMSSHGQQLILRDPCKRSLLPNDTSGVENQSPASGGPEHQLLAGTEHPRGAQSSNMRDKTSGKFDY